MYFNPCPPICWLPASAGPVVGAAAKHLSEVAQLEFLMVEEIFRNVTKPYLSNEINEKY